MNSSDGLQKFVKDSTTVSNFTGHYLSRSTDVSPRECDDKTKIIFVGMYTSDDAAVYLIYVIYVQQCIIQCQMVLCPPLSFVAEMRFIVPMISIHVLLQE